MAEDSVTVFGAALCLPGSTLYNESVVLGQLLAKAGFTVVNGGYTGTMEGSAKGATEAGGRAVGIIVPSLFTSRSGTGNDYLTTSVATETLLTRIETLLAASAYSIALPGTVGTLTELCAAWNTASLAVLHGREPPIILAYRKPWEAILEACKEGLGVGEATLAMVTLVDDAQDAVDRIVAVRASRNATAEASSASASTE